MSELGSLSPSFHLVRQLQGKRCCCQFAPDIRDYQCCADGSSWRSQTHLTNTTLEGLYVQVN
jgi:hypothetical protein